MQPVYDSQCVDDDDDNTGWVDAAGLPRYDDHDDDDDDDDDD